jgi:uncharacterized protein YbaR (Trm112 family)
MCANSEKPMQFDAAVADMLACPSCHGDLRVEGERLVCGGCGRRYPIVDGIPVLIVEGAENALTS